MTSAPDFEEFVHVMDVMGSNTKLPESPNEAAPRSGMEGASPPSKPKAPARQPAGSRIFDSMLEQKRELADIYASLVRMRANKLAQVTHAQPITPCTLRCLQGALGLISGFLWLFLPGHRPGRSGARDAVHHLQEKARRHPSRYPGARRRCTICQCSVQPRSMW